jgi:hypothetical protein
VQLSSALSSTEAIVNRMIRIVRGEKGLTEAPPGVEQDNFLSDVSDRLTLSFVERLKRNRLLFCPDDVGGSGDDDDNDNSDADLRDRFYETPFLPKT